MALDRSGTVSRRSHAATTITIVAGLSLAAGSGETGSKLEPQMDQWQTARIAADAKAWTEKNGKIVKLAPEEQQEAARRVSASAQSVVAKSAPLKELYEKLKAAAGN